MSRLHAESPSRGPGALGATPPPVGKTVRDLVRRRLALLPEPCRRLLDAASVLGRDFDLATLAAALARPHGELRDTLELALAGGIIRARPDALRSYAFVHALVRETIYQDVPVGDRSRLHLAMGEALEATAAMRDDRLRLLAHHFFAAAECADPTKAVRYGCEAGERALDLLAFEEAVAHFDRARLAADLLGDDEAKLRVLEGLGEALVSSGDAERAQSVLEQAVGLARAHGPERFAATVARAATIPAEVGKLDLATNALLEEALAGLPLAPSALRARLLARLASGLHLQPGAEQRRVALATEATAMARELGDPTTLGFVLTHRLLALLGPDRIDERLATVDEILRRGGAVRSRAAELAALAFRVHDVAELGDRTALDLTMADFEQRSRDYGHPFFRWLAAIFDAGVALLEGRFADAEAHANEGLARGQDVQLQSALLNYGQLMFALRGEQGRVAEVEALLTANVAVTAVVPAWRCGLAEFYNVSGRIAEARRELDALAVDDFAGLPRDTTWLTATYLLSNLCADLGEQRRAAVLADLLAPWSGRIAAARPLVVALGPIDLVLGRLAATQGLLDRAERHYVRALALSERMRGLTWQAHVHHAFGALFVARSSRADRERAAAHLDRAEAAARDVGMNLLLGWIEATRAAMNEAQGPRASAPAEPPTSIAEAAPTPTDGPATEATAPGRGGAISREGDLWTILLEGRTTRVKHMVGLTHLARLVAHPGEEVHVGDLMAAAYEGRREGRETPGEPEGHATDDAGEVLDRKARAAYEARLRDTREELAEATHLNDRGRMERLGAEMEALTQELARGFGLGGRARRAASTAERARVAVLRAIKYAIDKLAEQDPELAEHFRRSVRTGAFCVYDPPSRDVILWTLHGAR
jgi:tetratricopeptide (TPR) repeat protein